MNVEPVTSRSSSLTLLLSRLLLLCVAKLLLEEESTFPQDFLLGMIIPVRHQGFIASGVSLIRKVVVCNPSISGYEATSWVPSC